MEELGNRNIYITVVILLSQMLKKDNRTKLLEVFFDDPLPKGIGYQLREISRKIDLAPKSVKLYLEELEKEDLITKKEHRIHKSPVYYGNRDSDYFKLLKKINLLKRIKECGLLEYIEDKCMPNTIILFGSSSKGEDIKESDIDLFLQCNSQEVNLKKYEKELNRKINLFFEKKFNKLSVELKNNIVNGDILKGYLQAF